MILLAGKGEKKEGHWGFASLSPTDQQKIFDAARERVNRYLQFQMAQPLRVAERVAPEKKTQQVKA